MLSQSHIILFTLTILLLFTTSSLSALMSGIKDIDISTVQHSSLLNSIPNNKGGSEGFSSVQLLDFSLCDAWESLRQQRQGSEAWGWWWWSPHKGLRHHPEVSCHPRYWPWHLGHRQPIRSFSLHTWLRLNQSECRDLAGRIQTSVIIATFSFNLTRNRTLILSLFFQQEEIPNTRHWKYFYCNCTEYVKVLMIWCDHNSVLATHALNHNPSIPKAFRPSKYICNWVFSEARRQSLPPPADPAEPGGPDEQGRDSAAGRLPEDQGRL